MIAVGIARLQDGRVTPENVRPRAKNPIIAGFFREIGRADRLGSGVRNLYKYSKDYGGADHVEVFGRALVMKVCGLADGPAGMLIRTMLRHRLLDTVKGRGKGKYRFRSEFSGANP